LLGSFTVARLLKAQAPLKRRAHVRSSWPGPPPPLSVVRVNGPGDQGPGPTRSPS
jgi:hypothetical protein